MKKLFFVLLGCLMLPAFAFAQPSERVPPNSQFGEFSLLPNVSINMLLIYDGVHIGDSEEAFTKVDYDPIINDFPAAGWQTMKVNMFTGGANCCMGYYLLSQSKDQAAAVYFPPNDQLMVMEESRQFSISDPFFMYYGLEANNVQVSLSRVDSPRISRLLVFADNKWRIDRPGEFPAFYNQLALRINEQMPPISRDITLAYCMLMAGNQADTVKARFMQNPPEQYKAIYPLIFKDIEKTVKEFQPVQNLNLSGK